MTLPSVIRIFFAIDLSPEDKNSIGRYISLLKKAAKTNTIRWSNPENLHITLQFLAQVATVDIPKLMEKVRSNIDCIAINPHPITFKKLALFPSNHRPRVIVLDVSDHKILSQLSTEIGKGIEAANYPIESRTFRAHLTLARIKHPQSVNLEFLKNYPAIPLNQIEVKEVILFRSEPLPFGSRYSRLDEIELGKCHDKAI